MPQMPLPKPQPAAPLNVPQALDRALQYHHRGQLAEADALYGAILAVRPDNFDALQMRGLIRLGHGDLAEALRLVGAAMKQRPTSPQVLLNYGIVLNALNRNDEALATFEQAIQRKSKYAEAHNNRGAVLAALDRHAEALESYERALAIKPDYPDALSNKGYALRMLGRTEEALLALDRAIALQPNFARAHNHRGTVFEARKQYAEALTCYERALAIDPRYIEPINNRGRVLRALQRHDEALAELERAIVINPGYAQAHYNRAAVLCDLNRYNEAIESYGLALLAKPDFAEAKVGACIAELPIIYRDRAEIAERRAAYEKRIRAFAAEVDGMSAPGTLAKAVGPNQPFYLAYQGENDRALQSIYGKAMCRIMADRYPQAALAPPPAPGEKVRVGIVSAFFNDHSNWKIPIKGWLSQLDRGRFRMFGYHTGEKRDTETTLAASLCERFVDGVRTTEDWRREILADAPHVLIYPEVGMDGITAQLAAQRLAKVQCNSWGHPETSGFPTLDYFLSSDLMEPPEGHENYSERLIRLPNISFYYETPPTPSVPVTRGELGLRDEAIVFWCGQSIYKYLPQYDAVFARIAREVPGCQFAFLAHQGAKAVTALFAERLDKTFAAHGLDARDHCAVLPRLDRNRFAAAIGQCDIVLDSIGWSGCNSTLEGLVHARPVVTMDFGLMRGRHTAAIFRMMGIPDTIAADVDGYVAMAVELARDPMLRGAITMTIEQNRERLYRDRACIVALEDFLEAAARGNLTKI